MSRKSPVAIRMAMGFSLVEKPLCRGQEFSGEQLVTIWDHCVLLGDFTPQTICRVLVHGSDAASVTRTIRRFVTPETDGRQDVLARIKGIRRLVKYNREEPKPYGQERRLFKECIKSGSRTRVELALLFHLSYARVRQWADYLGLTVPK